MKTTTIGLDLAKTVFQVHGVDAAGRVTVRKKLRRSELLTFFEALAPCMVGVEACATAHHWARELSALGHEVRLMPAAYVKAYVRRQKNDAADAEAICEAVTRPTMRFVPIKSADRQGVLVLHRNRGCCQPNGNFSPVDAARAGRSWPQAARVFHSASAAERRPPYLAGFPIGFPIAAGLGNCPRISQ